MKRQPWSDNAETLLDGLDDRHRPAPTPERIGAYRVEGRLGLGGMGEVFLAWDERLKRRVAIKRIRQDIGLTPEQRERFRREAQLAARLSHPAVVQIHTVCEEDDAIVMEYVEGQTLAERLTSERLEIAEVLRLASEIAQGLAAAHEAGLVHRDLKAANVLVTPAGDAKILDFGLARLVIRSPEDQGFTRQGVVLGTCHAMSPEQARGEEVDERSDLFSFGALVHEMLTGRPPFRGNDPIDSLRKVVTEEPVDPRKARPDLPVEAARLLRRLLAKNRNDRPASAREVIDVLERLRGTPSGSQSAALAGSAGGFSSGTPTQPEPYFRDTRRASRLAWTRLLLLPAGAAASLVIAGAVALFLVASPMPRSNVRDEDWAKFAQIQMRVNAGVVSREGLDGLQEIIVTSPDFPDARALAARIARSLFEEEKQPADLEKASQLIAEAMDLFPQEPAPLREAARIAFERNQLHDAETFLDRLARLNPEDPQVLPLRARLAEERGNLDEAARLLRAAVAKNPSSWRNRYRLALVEEQLHRIEEARRQIGIILAWDPDNRWAQESLGHIELIYGDPDRAEQIYREVLGSPRRLLNNLGQAYLLSRQYQRAEDVFQGARKSAPEDAVTLVNLADAEIELGRTRSAEGHYRQALEILEKKAGASPTDLSSRDQMLLAQCQARLGDTERAVENARASLRRDADEPERLQQAALVYILARDRAAALEKAQAALERGLRKEWFSSSAFRELRKALDERP